MVKSKKRQISENGFLKITKEFIVYVDVDNTLMGTHEGKEVPLRGTIKMLKQLHEKGFELYCWSQCGKEYAKFVCDWLGISDLFQAFLPKPNMIIDDHEWSEWCGQRIDPKELG